MTFRLHTLGLAPIFRPMKSYVLLTALVAGLTGFATHAQDSATAIAEKQEAEERYKTLSTRLENLEEAIQAYQKRMNALAEELKSVREEMVRLGSNTSINAATQKSLENLAEAIKEVDRKRLEDNKRVLTALDDIRKGLTERSAPTVRPNPPTVAPQRNPNEPGYEYTVQANDNPYVIASKLTKQGLKVTSKQIMEANPGVNWTRLKIGQKLFIPEPPK